MWLEQTLKSELLLLASEALLLVAKQASCCDRLTTVVRDA